MNAQAKVDFTAREAGRVVEVELNQNLRVNAVRDISGKPVTYDRDDNAATKLRVTLGDTVPVGAKVTLLFDYGGPLSSRISNPRSGTRGWPSLARARRIPWLPPGRWFPADRLPSNRYTGIFQIEVPGTMTVGGRGTAAGVSCVRDAQIAAPAPSAAVCWETPKARARRLPAPSPALRR